MEILSQKMEDFKPQKPEKSQGFCVMSPAKMGGSNKTDLLSKTKRDRQNTTGW